MKLKELKQEITRVERLQEDIKTIKRAIEVDILNEYRYGTNMFIDEQIIKEAYRESYKILLKEKETELEIKMKKIKEKVLI